MTIILIAVAIVVAVVVAVVVVFVVYSLQASRKQAKQPFEALPPSISVMPGDERWRDPAKVYFAEEELKSQKFVEVGTFVIPELGSLAKGLLNKSENTVALVFDHPEVGVWTEVSLEYENGNRLTVSNAPHMDASASSPGHKRIVDRAIRTADLTYRLLGEAERLPRRIVTTDNFVHMLVDSYRRDYDWRTNGGANGGGKQRSFTRVVLPCGGKRECPYENQGESGRDIEGMPFPDDPADRRACPTYGHICPFFMEEMGLTQQELAIRATIHCGQLAENLVRQGRLGEDSREYITLMKKYNDLTMKYPPEDFPKYY